MNNSNGTVTCAIGCWLVAALAGLLAAILLMLLGGWTFMQAALIGFVVLAIAGLLLSWILCRPLPAVGEATIGEKSTATQKAEAARAMAEERSAAAAAARAAEPPQSPAAEPISVSPVSSAPAPTASYMPSKALPGQDELATRKGTWKYEAEPAAKTAPKEDAKTAPKEEAPAKAPAKKAAAKKAPAKAAKPAVADAGEATKSAPVAADGKPQQLSTAREGGADDLKMIKGVGPKLEALLNSMGFFHFDQVAGWRKKEVEWVDENLEGFKGRVSRDEWVKQAKILAKGGTTEFSSKVKKGGVY